MGCKGLCVVPDEGPYRRGRCISLCVGRSEVVSRALQNASAWWNAELRCAIVLAVISRITGPLFLLPSTSQTLSCTELSFHALPERKSVQQMGPLSAPPGNPIKLCKLLPQHYRDARWEVPAPIKPGPRGVHKGIGAGRQEARPHNQSSSLSHRNIITASPDLVVMFTLNTSLLRYVLVFIILLSPVSI